MGGLGNQMFQYALGRKLSIINNEDLRFDLTFLLDRMHRDNFVFRDYDLDIFSLSCPITFLSRISKNISVGPFIFSEVFYQLGKRLFPKRFLAEHRNYFYDDTIFSGQKSLYLVGYWQSYKYFYDIEDVLKKELVFCNSLVGDSLDLYENIRSTNSICVNVRRADYVNNPKANAFHGVLGMDFYYQAISIMIEKVHNPYFFIFSDDIEWCRNNFNINYPVFFVDHSYKGPKFSYYLQLMISCRNFIIPNSTFAWWAAWLNNDKEKVVIAPKEWVKNKDINIDDVLPLEWIKI